MQHWWCHHFACTTPTPPGKACSLPRQQSGKTDLATLAPSHDSTELAIDLAWALKGYYIFRWKHYHWKGIPFGFHPLWPTKAVSLCSSIQTACPSPFTFSCRRSNIAAKWASRFSLLDSILWISLSLAILMKLLFSSMAFWMTSRSCSRFPARCFRSSASWY